MSPRKSSYGAILVLGLLFLPESVPASDSVDVPVHHWSYQAIERLAAQGYCSGLGLGMRPLTRGWVAEEAAEAIEATEESIDIPHSVAYQIEEDLLALSRTFAPELKRRGVPIAEEEKRQAGEPFQWKGLTFQTELVSEKIGTDFQRGTTSSLLENSQGFRLKDGVNGRWHLPSWLGIGEWFAATLDPSLRYQEKDSDADFDFEEVSLKTAYRNLELKAGELNFWWGPGYHSELLLTDNTRPLRAFSFRTKRGFQLPWKLKVLGKWQAQLFGARLDEKRTIKEALLAGTRVEWAPIRRIVVGVAHTALFGGEGEKERLSDFLNALDPTAGGGANERPDHLFGGDIRFFIPEVVRWFRLGSGLEVYGEFFGEDTKGVYIPQLVSYLGGVLITDLFSFAGLDFRFEGATTDAGAYEHFAQTSGYRYKNEFIGHHVGEDAEDIFFRLAKTFFYGGKRLVAGVQFDGERRGVSGAALSFGEAAQTKKEVQLDLTHEVSEHVSVSLAYQFEDVNNFQGSTGVETRNHIIVIQTTLRF